MKVALIFCACIAATQAGLVALPYAPTIVRAPSFDSAVIQADRIGGNFAYSSLAGHSYATWNPTFGYTNPYGYQLLAPQVLTNNVLAPGQVIVPGQTFVPGQTIVPAQTLVPGQTVFSGAVLPGTILTSGLAPVDKPEEPSKEEAKPEEEQPQEQPAEEEKPAEAEPQPEEPQTDNVDESVGEANQDGADESTFSDEAPQSDDEAVSVDSA